MFERYVRIVVLHSTLTSIVFSKKALAAPSNELSKTTDNADHEPDFQKLNISPLCQRTISRTRLQLLEDYITAGIFLVQTMDSQPLSSVVKLQLRKHVSILETAVRMGHSSSTNDPTFEVSKVKNYELSRPLIY